MKRCLWAKDPLMIEYHDKEWGVPEHDDTRLFEMLILEGAQAGLSWSTVLKRRWTYRAAFDNFDPSKISQYTARDVKRLLADEGIIRNRLKVESAINNAKQFLKVQEEFGTFDRYIWDFVDCRQIQNRFRVISDIPPSTPISDKISADLKKRGFNFVGSTICYAFMQAVGLVNDHVLDCHRHNTARQS